MTSSLLHNTNLAISGNDSTLAGLVIKTNTIWNRERLGSKCPTPWSAAAFSHGHNSDRGRDGVVIECRDEDVPQCYSEPSLLCYLYWYRWPLISWGKESDRTPQNSLIRFFVPILEKIWLHYKFNPINKTILSINIKHLHFFLLFLKQLCMCNYF